MATFLIFNVLVVAFAPVLGYYMWDNPNPTVFNWRGIWERYSSYLDIKRWMLEIPRLTVASNDYLNCVATILFMMNVMNMLFTIGRFALRLFPCYRKGRTSKGFAGALERGLKRAVPGWQGTWEEFGKWIGHLGPPITCDFTPAQAFDPIETTRRLIEGCLTYKDPNTQISALCWGLASAYRAAVDHVQKAKAETGMQTMPLGMEPTRIRAQMPLEASTAWTKPADIGVPIMDFMNMGTHMSTPPANSMNKTGAHTTNPEITIAPITKKKMWIRDDAESTSLAPQLRRVTEEEEELAVREGAHPKELGARPKERGMPPKEEGAAAQVPDGTQKPPRRMLTPEYTLLDCSTEEMEDYLKSSSQGPEDYSLPPPARSPSRHRARSPSPQPRKPSLQQTQPLPLPPQHRSPSPRHVPFPPPHERGRVETVPHRYVKREVEMDRRDVHPEAGVVRTSEVLRSLTPAEVRDLRKDYSRLPGERILTWLVRCWDNGAGSHMLEGHEAQQLRSLARDREIEQGIAQETYSHSFWLRILNAVRERYPFKEYLTSSPGKWTTAEEGVQYLRELAMLELIFSNPDYYDVLDPASLPCTNPMWRKLPNFSIPSKSDEPDVETMCHWIQNIAENFEDVQRQPTRKRVERDYEYSSYEDDYKDRDDSNSRDYRDTPVKRSRPRSLLFK